MSDISADFSRFNVRDSFFKYEIFVASIATWYTTIHEYTNGQVSLHTITRICERRVVYAKLGCFVSRTGHSRYYNGKQKRQLVTHKREATYSGNKRTIICRRDWVPRDHTSVFRTYFLDPEVSVASIDPDCRVWDWGRIALDDDGDDERGFPLRVSSTRADSVTPSQPYLNQHRSCNVTRGWIVDGRT